jgi:hypothetical protein
MTKLEEIARALRDNAVDADGDPVSWAPTFLTREEASICMARAAVEAMREPTDEQIEAGARAICRQLGYDPDGKDYRPPHESPDGWANWMYCKTEARNAHVAGIDAILRENSDG